MNKTFCIFSQVVLLTWITAVAYSQTSKRNKNIKFQFPIEKVISLSEQLKANKGSGTIFLNDINIKAVRNFYREYDNVSDARWFKISNGYTVYFTNDDIQSKILYDQTGNLQQTIRWYYEDKLPGEVRHMVKRAYYDYNIFLVVEVCINGKTKYLVKIEDKTSWKTIKVAENEMVVMEEYKKG